VPVLPPSDFFLKYISAGCTLQSLKLAPEGRESKTKGIEYRTQHTGCRRQHGGDQGIRESGNIFVDY